MQIFHSALKILLISGKKYPRKVRVI